MASRIEHYRFVPLDVLATPRDGQTLIDRWWLVHPERGAAFHQGPMRTRGYSPQCNHDRRLPDRLAPECGFDAEVVFIPCAFVGWYDDEWGYTLGGVPATTAAPAAEPLSPEDRAMADAVRDEAQHWATTPGGKPLGVIDYDPCETCDDEETIECTDCPELHLCQHPPRPCPTCHPIAAAW